MLIFPQAVKYQFRQKDEDEKVVEAEEAREDAVKRLSGVAPGASFQLRKLAEPGRKVAPQTHFLLSIDKRGNGESIYCLPPVDIAVVSVCVCGCARAL